MKFRHAGPTPLLLDLMQPPPLPRMHRLHIYITQFIPQPRPTAAPDSRARQPLILHPPRSSPTPPLLVIIPPAHVTHVRQPLHALPIDPLPPRPQVVLLAADAPVQQPDVLPGVDAQQRRGVDAAGRRGHLGPGGGRELAERAGRVLHLRLLRQRRRRWAAHAPVGPRRAPAHAAERPHALRVHVQVLLPVVRARQRRAREVRRQDVEGRVRRVWGRGPDEPDEARAEHGEHGGEEGFFEGGYGEVAL